MPKIERREFRWQKKKVRCNNANQHSGGGSRARKKNHPERLETQKYCKFCRTHTMHKETK